MSRGFVITQAGKKLLAELVATKQELNITKVLVGKGELQQGQTPEYFTDLIEPVTQATSTIPVVKNGVISFIVEYRNDLNGGLQEGFWLKEFGVFARDGEKEILLYYASLGEYPQYVEAYENGKVNIKKYPVAITVADGLKDDVNVTLEYAPVAFVTEQRMKEFVEIEALPYLEGVLAESENGILAELEKKANIETVEQALDTKANAQDVEIALNQKADIEVITEELAKKANTETVQQILNQKADAKAIEQALDKKADIEVVQQALDQKANEMEILQKLSEKADKEAMITELAVKADKEEVQTELDKKVDKEEIEEILQQQIDSTNIVLELDKKADKETVAEELAKKADAETMQEELNKKADAEIVSDALALKADSETMQTELDKKADIATMTEELAKKSNTSHTHNYAGSSSAGGVANSATKLNTARTIDGMPFDGSANIVHFGVCETAADVTAKVVALPGFVLVEGARIIVYFLNSHAKSSPSLNVNNTGAKPISCVVGTYAPLNQWEAKQAVEFIYYSNHWIMLTSNARRLYTARTIRTNLASTSSASFDGTANITPGVTGTLPIANDGTGAISASTALSNLGGFPKTGGTIDGNVDIPGNVKLKGSGNYGNKLNFGDGEYVYISEPSDDNLEIKAREVTIKAWDRTNSCINLNAQDSVKVTNGKFMSKSIISNSNNDMFLNVGENIIIGTRNLIGYNINVSFASTASGRTFILKNTPSYLSSYKAGDKLYFFNLVGSQLYNTYIVESIDGNEVTVTKDIVGLSSERGYQGYVCFDRVVGTNCGINGNAAIGYNNINIASNSFVFGTYNRSIASNSFVFGTCLSNKYNDTFLIGKYNNIISGKFIIGKGSSDKSTANCFRVTDTAVYATGNYNTTGADYAEYFEWEDGNPNNENRRGLFVALHKDKISLANLNDDFVLGIISGNPSVIGDSHEDQWNGMYLYDIYGTPIMEEVEVPERKEIREVMKQPIYDEDGNEIEQEKEYEEIIVEEARTEIRQKLNPNYNNKEKYIPRSERKEWGIVGMLGKLVAIDDGSCEENGWCKVGQCGIATKSEQKTRFRVMKRLDQNHIKIFIL